MAASSVTLLGVGKMGAAFVDRWVAADRPVVLWNRTRAAADALAGPLVTVCDSPATAAASSPVVVSMVINGAALREVLLEQGALAAMSPGSVLVDLSTVDVESSADVARAAKSAGIAYVRGAVSGTPPVVRGGNAALLLSGEAHDIALASQVLSELAPQHAVVGEHEEARIVKIAINAMLGGTMQLLAESVALAEASGVPRETFLDALDVSVLGSRFLSYKGAALRSRDYSPTFTTEGMKKDLTLATEQAARVDTHLPVVDVVVKQLSAVIDAGYANDDFLSLMCLQQRTGGMTVDVER
jgi:3-hydroxyisobutyrate dehydrogenase-like beta-hydroxyacid dehydrogenase